MIDVSESLERSVNDDIWFKSKDKLILDATCGARMSWINKNHPDALYIDIREAPKGYVPERPNFSINPDLVLDFRNLPFPDRMFKLVFWDPPHIIRKGGKLTGYMRNKYGCLDSETWKDDLIKGFNELWRVLDNYGVLIFKWSECDKPIKEVLSLFPQEALFGHPTGKIGSTFWVVFFKNEVSI